jgi:hypothetical protein
MRSFLFSAFANVELKIYNEQYIEFNAFHRGS